MITVTTKNNLVSAAVLGEFTLADFREFEQQADAAIKLNGKASLLVDLRDMVSMTVDVALEEMRFSRNHRGAFEKIAIVTENTIQQWEALLSNIFTDATVEVFEDEEVALDWLGE